MKIGQSINDAGQTYHWIDNQGSWASDYPPETMLTSEENVKFLRCGNMRVIGGVIFYILQVKPVYSDREKNGGWRGWVSWTAWLTPRETVKEQLFR